MKIGIFLGITAATTFSDMPLKRARGLKLDIDLWLRDIGLPQYAENFRANQIDGELLSRLSNEDLKDIGVALLGDRKRMLKALAALGPNREASAAVSVAIQDAAERRQLTVMFVDLVGSTRLSARLDPEDMREVIATYHQCCADRIEANGGLVAQYAGDGVLACFGYPRAHEHDAERAVRAGLEIAEAAPKLKTVAQAPLRVRLGIATGIVVVGDLLGSGAARDLGVVGDTPNLAARMQEIAEPGQVVIAEGTRRLVGELFELTDLGFQELKSVAGQAHAWAAVRQSSKASRFEALHSGGLTPLVGRDEEIGLLQQCWAKAKGGHGQVVLLSGEAGIGKSRLTAALLETLGDEPHARLRYFCSPQHTDSAFYPIIGQMIRRAGLSRDDDAKTKLDKLDALLAMSAASREDVGAPRRYAVAAKRWPLSRVAPPRASASAENDRGFDGPRRNPVAPVSGPDDFGGRALGRSFKPRGVWPGHRQDWVPAGDAAVDIPSGVWSALAWPLQCDGADNQPARGQLGFGPDRPRRRQQRAAA